MSIRITCINKDGGNHENPHVAISGLGWLNENTGETGYIDRVALYEWLLASSSNRAYVKDSLGEVAYLEPLQTVFGTKYVRTIPDGTSRDNLLTLPECRG